MVGVKYESDQSDSSSIISSATDDSDYEIVPRYVHTVEPMERANIIRVSEPVSSLGRKIHDFITSSDEESDSGEDDIEYIGTLPGVPGVTYVPHSLVGSEVDDDRRTSGSSHLRNSQTLWRNGQTLDSRTFSSRSGLTAWEEDTPDSSKVMRAFMRVTEEQAMVRKIHHNQDGNWQSEGRSKIRKRPSSTTVCYQAKGSQSCHAGGTGEIVEGRWRDGGAVARTGFAAGAKGKRVGREICRARGRSWSKDIDAAITGAEQRESEARAAAIAKVKKQKEEEEAKKAAAAQEAQARRATAEKMAKEKMAKEKMEKDRLEAAAKEQKDKNDVVEKAKLEEKRVESAKRGQTSSEWKNWVDKQNWMKTEVINVIKADKATRTGLRPTMRLMTRNLGQVTNAKETVLRIVSCHHTQWWYADG
jgi:hypothetical protein